MKLKKAHINDFGKFHNADFNFNAGLNSFVHENGWGKTTLSVFIKSMLYGMEYTTSKELKKNEKLKYLPWQGGIYGGFLEFEHNGKNYKVSRTFNMKKGGDTFALFDLQTNKPSADFSEKLGEEIYGVNRDTYEHSVHITLDESPAASPDISAKLNNLIESDDVGNYDAAFKLLDEKATELKAKRGGSGEIAKLQNKIDDNRELLSDINARIKQNENYERQIAELESTALQIKNEQNSLAEELANAAKYESKIRYEQLKNDEAAAKKNKIEIEKFFNGHIPDNSILNSIDSALQNFTTLESNVKTNSMTQAEKDNYNSLKKYFAGDIPSDEQIASCRQANEDYRTLKKEEEYEKQLSAEENERKKKQLNNKQIAFIITSLAFLLVGIASFLFLKNIIALLVGIVLGCMAALFAIIFKLKKDGLKKQESRYDAWLSKQRKTPQELEGEIKSFIKRYCRTEDISFVSAELDSLNARLSKLRELEKKTNADSGNEKKFLEAKEKLVQILSQYGTEKTYGYSAQVQQIHTKIVDLKNAKNSIAEAEEKIHNFEADPKNDIKIFATLEEPKKSVDELNAQNAALLTRQASCNKELSDIQKRLSDNLSFTEKKGDVESDIERLSDEKNAKEVEYDLLVKTRDFLAAAKERLDANYSDPMKEGFEKYVKMLGGKLTLLIDTDLKVSVDEGGQNYESGFLSEGYKDMVNFCSRMALVDSLFKETQVALIFDDPFVNLDDDKIPHALDLVKNIAKERQILYFSCHKSRDAKSNL